MILLFENGAVHNYSNLEYMVDPTWNELDKALAKTFEMRFKRLGLKESERMQLVMMIVLKKKHSGLLYSEEIENKLKTLLIE
jgi:hypothetical protein